MLLDLFVYPVSGIMKLWHLLLHVVFGLDDSMAWVLSVFGLVIVVRGLIAPFSLMQSRSGRISAILRPKLKALDAEYHTRADKESVAEHAEKRKQLREDYGHSTAAGCIPPLIQLPVFIGLYQFLLRMARPAEGLDSAQRSSIGFLSSTEVEAFLDGHIFGVPLPAYIAMSEEQFTQLGTTQGEVLQVVLPMLAVAILFTILNFRLSFHRNNLTMDWDSKVARVLGKALVVLFVLIPFLLIWLALAGPLPAAIIFYWVANNLWTLVQANTIHRIIQRQLPLDDEFIQHRDRARAAHEARVQEEKELKQLARAARRDPELAAQLAAKEKELQEARAAEKSENKRLNKAKTRARLEMNREKRAQKRAGKQKPAHDGGPVPGDAGQEGVAKPGD
ncbi:Membrane protein insertase MisCB precursor [Corynebacterium occultum]|uniref:Membrane protein insertase YidC n=1 Tax=Corynebacterium occultum TaxID=2675219 RepID=A0A6B8W4U4_9CORY|nr:Membrane protein insertase MisCB precursor [Corynebacterium occultum]